MTPEETDLGVVLFIHVVVNKDAEKIFVQVMD